MDIKSTIGHTIGSTPLVELKSVAAGVRAKVLAKLEFFNPLGQRQGPHRPEHDRSSRDRG